MRQLGGKNYLACAKAIPEILVMESGSSDSEKCGGVFGGKNSLSIFPGRIPPINHICKIDPEKKAQKGYGSYMVHARCTLRSCVLVP